MTTPTLQEDYKIKEILFQSQDLIIYRMLGKDGKDYSVIRIKFPTKILDFLSDGSFEKGLGALLQIRHNCLRPVMDGGIDEVDGFPWIASYWYGGETLAEREEQSSLTAEDIERIDRHAKKLISELGDRAGAISFAKNDIIATKTANGNTVETFSIDFIQWFRDWATGYAPGTGKDPDQALENLISSLKPAKSDSKSQKASPPKEKAASSEDSPSLPPPTLPPPVKPTPPKPPTPPPPPAKKPTPAPSSQSNDNEGGLDSLHWIIIAIFSIILAGGFWWILQQKKSKPRKDRKPPEQSQIIEEEPVGTPPEPEETPPSEE